MNTEELFKYGVTPKEGAHAGERFRVMCIMPDKISVSEWDKEKPTVKLTLNHGEYRVYSPPKTLFEDDSIPATWGNLKRAVEEAGISDDTEFAIQEDALWLSRGICRPATFSIENLRQVYGKPKTYILVK
jgi:hypothetical protein